VLTLRLDPVTSTIVHSSGTVVATSSGQRSTELAVEVGDSSSDEDEENSDFTSSSSEFSLPSADSSINLPKAIRKLPDNSIKVWKIT
jgi:hypothetical protein